MPIQKVADSCLDPGPLFKAIDSKPARVDFLSDEDLLHVLGMQANDSHDDTCVSMAPDDGEESSLLRPPLQAHLGEVAAVLDVFPTKAGECTDPERFDDFIQPD